MRLLHSFARTDFASAPLRLSFLVLAVLVAVTSACSNSPASPTTTPPFSQTDLKVGDGTEAANGNLVTVNYTGWLYDASKTDGTGLQFDTTTGRTPFTFTLGSSQVIEGWDKGVVGMKVGGIRRLVIPPSLGYGSSRIALIPPNAALVFDIELLDVQ